MYPQSTKTSKKRTDTNNFQGCSCLDQFSFFYRLSQSSVTSVSMHSSSLLPVSEKTPSESVLIQYLFYSELLGVWTLIPQNLDHSDMRKFFFIYYSISSDFLPTRTDGANKTLNKCEWHVTGTCPLRLAMVDIYEHNYQKSEQSTGQVQSHSCHRITCH